MSFRKRFWEWLGKSKPNKAIVVARRLPIINQVREIGFHTFAIPSKNKKAKSAQKSIKR